ncbi:MAG: sigma-70 family RNA polymerase sigma factor [Bacteroidales bacterium]|jgi:RNA polymerase sigma-70 factor (ECF subfamily)|nr:sigma-70 family RNA polymerase sigma factor [Bacteroidales bacterium]
MFEPLDPSFIGRLKKGDQQAIAEWYDTAAPGLLSVCMRYSSTTYEAEDLLHDGLMKVLNKIHTFQYRNPGGFEAWVKRVLVNTALNYLRSEGKKIAQNFDIFTIGETMELDEENEEFPRDIDPDLIIQWIRELPDGYRTVLNLYVFESYSHKEISEVLGVSESTSKSQLFKARAMLRKRAASALILKGGAYNG